MMKNIFIHLPQNSFSFKLDRTFHQANLRISVQFEEGRTEGGGGRGGEGLFGTVHERKK